MAGILSGQEKAYCRGLDALRKNDYIVADKFFKECSELHRGSHGFEIIAQATQMLVFIEGQKQKQHLTENTKEIEENGKETILLGQGLENEKS